MTRSKNQRKTNGHAGPHDRTNSSGNPDPVRVNGHAPASTARGGISVQGDQAASDDASGGSVAIAAISAAAGTAREACADAATPPSNGAVQEAAEKESSSAGKKKQVPPGEGPLPATADEFVDEIHSRIDLFEVWVGLLRSEDEKVRQRAAERLTDLGYKGAAALDDEPRRIIIDMPRPDRD